MRRWLNFAAAMSADTFPLFTLSFFKVGLLLWGRGSGVGGVGWASRNVLPHRWKRSIPCLRRIHGYCDCLHSSMHVCLFCSGAWLLFCKKFFFFCAFTGRPLPRVICCFVDGWHCWCMCACACKQQAPQRLNNFSTTFQMFTASSQLCDERSRCPELLFSVCTFAPLDSRRRDCCLWKKKKKKV